MKAYELNLVKKAVRENIEEAIRSKGESLIFGLDGFTSEMEKYFYNTYDHFIESPEVQQQMR